MLSPPGVAAVGQELASGLTLLLSSHCNLSCDYCYQGARSGPARMPWPVARASLDFLLAHGRPPHTLEFSGGEPLLAADLFRRCVAYVQERRLRADHLKLVLATNGLLLTDDILAFLVEQGVYLHLSFDGPAGSQDLRGEGTFETLDGLIDRMASNHPDFWRDSVSVSVVVHGGSLPDMAEAARYFLAKGTKTVVFSPAAGAEDPWDAGCEAALCAQLEAIVRDALRHFAGTGEVVVTFLDRPAASSRNGPFLCGAGYGQGLCVDTEGTVWTCPLFASSLQDLPPLAREVSRATRLGRIADEDLWERLVALPERTSGLPLLTRRTEKRSGHGRCIDCEFCEECFICPAAASHDPGNADPHRIPDFHCAFVRATAEARRAFQNAIAHEAPRRKGYLLG